ncbi:MAG TPA: WXG100 family type VII secretion target [Clostridium sp.]|nr:WXG100 family type VII secretion target [Clostridium sp.]
MADQIRISPERMLERSREYQVEADNIQTVIEKMTSLINELQTEWEGAASASFAEQFNELKPSFINMHDLVETISRQLSQTGQAMQQMDEEISKKFGVQ